MTEESLSAALTLVELREMRLLSRGILDGYLTRDEAIQTLREGQVSDPETVLDELISRAVVLETPACTLRSRMAEAVHMMATARQWFPRRSSWEAAELFFDFRLRQAARLRPARSRTLEEVIKIAEERLRRGGRNAVSTICKPTLSSFQLESTEAVLAALSTERPRGVVIGAGTGSGKTLAFYLPALSWIVDSIDDDATPFVKTLAIYPRSELLKDQLRTAVGHAIALNEVAVGRRSIRVGTWFGGTPRAAFWLERGWSSWEIVGRKSSPDGWICPFVTCPEDFCQGPMVWSVQDVKARLERLQCKDCGSSLGDDILCLTRDSARARPPDVMFTTTESLNRQLSAPDTHRAFGLAGPRRVRMVLLDEVHTYEGITGAQNAYLLRRLRHVAKQQSLLFTGLSATLLRAQEFFAQLTDVREADIEVIEPCLEELEESGAEYQIALRHNPASQTGPLSATIQTAMALQRTLDVGPLDRVENPFLPISTVPNSGGLFGSRTFVFTDKLDVTNRLFWDLLDAEGWWDDKGRPRERVPSTLAHLRSTNQSRLDESYREVASSRANAGQQWWLAEYLGHGLENDQQLRIGRTSSQDQGVSDADVIVATATLEVGYDDERVGAVLQHKAPHNAARFLQRKGRAGRTTLMRPWTAVVLSDFGRDRLAFEAYDQLFNPQLEASRLPLGNRYVLKMQAVYAMLDWLSTRVDERDPDRSSWADLAGPAVSVESSESRGKMRAQRQNRVAEILRSVLYGGPERAGLTHYLAQALNIPDREVKAMLWSAPRSLLLAVIPTALRRLESQWDGERPRVGDSGIRTRTPLREFIAGNLFDDLLVSDVILVLPAEGQSEEAREEGLPVARTLQEFLPGNVSRHFGVGSFGRRHWVPLPENGRLSIDHYSGRFIRAIASDEGTSIRVYEPRRVELSLPPSVIADSTSSDPCWEAELDAIGSGSRVRLPDAWKTFLPEFRFRMHADGDAVRITRFTRSSAGTIRKKEGASATSCSFYDEEGAAALGFEIEVDGIDFDIDLPILGAVTPLERSLRFRALLDQNPTIRAFHHLQRAALAQGVLLCVADHVDAETVSGWTNRDFARYLRDALARLGLKVAPETPKSGEEFAGDDDPTETLKSLDEAITSDQVLDTLKLTLRAASGGRDEEWNAWQRRRIASAAASVVLEASSRLVPSINADQFTVDITQPSSHVSRVWLCETGPGGNGLVEALYVALGDSTVELRRLIQASLAPGGLEALALELDSVLDTPCEGLLDAVDGILAAWPTGHKAVEDAVDRLRESVSDVSQEAVAAITARLAYPGAAPGLAEAAGHLVRRWRNIESSTGFAIDVRTFSCVAGADPKLDDELGLNSSDSTARSAAVSRLMWPRSLSLAGAEDRGRSFTERLSGDGAALAAYVPAPWQAIECTSIDEARGAVLRYLPSDGAVALRFVDVDLAKKASTILIGEAVEVDALLVYPKIISTTLHPRTEVVFASTELAE